MSAHADLFAGGPPLKLQLKVGLVRPGRLYVARRSFIFAAIAWLPLALLAGIEGNLFASDEGRAFILDFGAFARFVVAVPLLVAAEAVCIPALGNIANRFVESGIVPESDTIRFAQAVSTTRSLRDAPLAEFVVVMLAYAVVIAAHFPLPVSELPMWHQSNADVNSLSLAGWWHALVSVPLLLILILGCFWRVFLWTRFLTLMSRLDLRLVPVHPDKAGGLRFVGLSLRSFCLAGAAFGAIVAGTVANHVMHRGAPLTDYRYAIAGVVAFVVVLFAAPLLAFTYKLLTVWRRGIKDYGGLATAFGQQFETKWFTGHPSMHEDVLERQDFSAATDLYQVCDRVGEMRYVPVDLASVVMLAGATLLPFVPVVLMALPFDVIWDALLGLLR